MGNENTQVDPLASLQGEETPTSTFYFDFGAIDLDFDLCDLDP